MGVVIARAPHELLDQARGGSRAALARLISYVEGSSDRRLETVALAYASRAPYVVGLTGAPGAGKSTLTDQLIRTVLSRTPRDAVTPTSGASDAVAVLCVDPSSPFTGGALLGDRYRMQDHATDDRVFIRSLATRGNLGGLSLAVPDAVRILGAAGFELLLLETVGVGQMEVDVAANADSTVVVVTPAWGDALQAEKAGILEVADVFVVNKADRDGTLATRRDLERMLDMGNPSPWRPPIVETVASEGRGVDALWTALGEHRAFLDGGEGERRRRRRAAHEIDRALSALARESAREGDHAANFEEQLEAVLAGATDPYRAAQALFLRR